MLPIEGGREPQNDKERAKAKRILKTYGWTWAMYWALGVKQGWKCAICGREAKNAPLNVDHEHFKVAAWRNYPAFVASGGKKWQSEGEVRGVVYRGGADTKIEAIQKLREIMLPKSVRGLLCPGRHGKAGSGCCNRLLGRVDNVEWLEKARNYLLDPPAKSVIK